MPGPKKRKKHLNHKNEITEVDEVSVNPSKKEPTITINIQFNYSIGNKEFHIEQRAEGGGQINKNVGTNANQGGQNAIDHSETANKHSQFADGNGRSGIAGKNNDEAGGQQGIKVRDSNLIKSIIKSASDQAEVHLGEEPDSDD